MQRSLSFFVGSQTQCVGFWCQGIAQKFFKTFDTSFDTKMMVKSGAIQIIFKLEIKPCGFESRIRDVCS